MDEVLRKLEEIQKDVTEIKGKVRALEDLKTRIEGMVTGVRYTVKYGVRYGLLPLGGLWGLDALMGLPNLKPMLLALVGG